MAAPVVTPDPALPDDVVVCHDMIRTLLTQLHDKNRELDGVQFRLDQLLRRLYGPRNERLRPDQPSLFEEPADAEPANEPAPAEESADNGQPRRRKGHGRRRLPADLVREPVIHDVSEAEKICPCCQKPRVRIGEEVSEQLDYRPAKLFVLQHVRLKYACPDCLATACAAAPITEETATAPAPAAATPAAEVAGEPTVPTTPTVNPWSLIVTASKPAQPIDKGLPGPGLLAYVVTSKYVDHLPLYRQVGVLARHGVELSRSTLCDWMAAAAGVLSPLYALMLKQVLQSRVIHTDETRLPVQERGQERTKSGRLWVYLGDRAHPHTVYDYRPDKSRDGPGTILAKYQGFVQADAANVFDGIYLPGSITEVGCWAHARRYFFEARTSDAARSAEALARIRGFYAIEDEAAQEIARNELAGDAADALRRRLRQEKTLSLLQTFAHWLEEQAKVVLPKSPMGQAIAYAQRHWQALIRFTEHGFLEIDNNAAERALRAIAIGRKNYLFVGSDQGGKTAAVLYTLTQTCKRHGIDPFAYLQDVLSRLPGLGAEHLEALLPHRWAAAQHAANSSRAISTQQAS
jgi:transposase